MYLGEIGSSYSRMWKNKKVYFKNQKYEIDIGKPPRPKRDKGNSTWCGRKQTAKYRVRAASTRWKEASRTANICQKQEEPNLRTSQNAVNTYTSEVLARKNPGNLQAKKMFSSKH